MNTGNAAVASESFLSALNLPAAVPAALAGLVAQHQTTSPEDLARDEDFWGTVRQCFALLPKPVNLNYGTCSPQPRAVQDAQAAIHRYANQSPSRHLWHELFGAREMIRAALAEAMGARPEEVALVRNTTEALGLAAWAIDLSPGDEIVLSGSTYINVYNTWVARAQRAGAVVRHVAQPTPLLDPDALVAEYHAVISPATKAVVVMHQNNYSADVLPVAEIAALAHAVGAWMVVDAAQTFIVIDHTPAELGADIWGTSLHKWCLGPFGTGALWVRQERIADLHAPFPLKKAAPDDIRKFEGLGTRDLAAELALHHSVAFVNAIGPANYRARLDYLTRHWTDQAAVLGTVRWVTDLNADPLTALCTFNVAGHSPEAVVTHLLEKHGLFTVAINEQDVEGVRISPHVFTHPKELDRLVEGLSELVV